QRRLQTSAAERLEDALLATGFPPDLRGQERTLDWWRWFSLRTRSLRRTGSTALNMAYAAAGRVAGYWAFDNHVWDVAAGVVLVREAGGTLSNVDGSPYDPYTPDALVTNGPLHPVMLEAFRKGLGSPAPPAAGISTLTVPFSFPLRSRDLDTALWRAQE